jgi:hypothetical protein
MLSPVSNHHGDPHLEQRDKEDKKRRMEFPFG